MRGRESPRTQVLASAELIYGALGSAAGMGLRENTRLPGIHEVSITDRETSSVFSFPRPLMRIQCVYRMCPAATH